jgi:hypothetical protein
MPENDIRTRNKILSFPVTENGSGPSESFSGPEKRIIRFLWGILSLYDSARVKLYHFGFNAGNPPHLHTVILPAYIMISFGGEVYAVYMHCSRFLI